jgi:polyphenol oxidase
MTTRTTSTVEFRRRGALELLTWPIFDAFAAEVVVSTRADGVSSSVHGDYASLNLSFNVGDGPENVIENRRRLASALGADLSDFVFARQVHGNTVKVVTSEDRGRGAFVPDDAVTGTDVLITKIPGIFLAILVADCVPIVLYDPVARLLACVHAGWRGTVARVTDAALDVMNSLGSNIENVIAGIGPAISPDGYQVGDDVAIAVTEALGNNASAVLRPDGTGRWLFDTSAANRLLLHEAGVRDDNIHLSNVYTGTPPDVFFSDRARRPCGRFALVARLLPQDAR